MRRLIDSHVHIDGFSDPDTLMQDCIKSGVDGVLCVGGDMKSSKKILKITKEYPEFYFPAIGVHPYSFLENDLEETVKFVTDNLENCVALGEVGLDYAYDFAKPKDIRAQMRDYLKRLLEVAVQFDKPVSLHSRSAYKDTLNLVSEAGVTGVFHWYDGPLHTLNDLLDAGYYVSATPSIECSKGAQSVMLKTPLERILVETDSPVYLRNLERKSTPVDVVRVVNALAELKELDVEDVARTTTLNAETLFGL